VIVVLEGPAPTWPGAEKAEQSVGADVPTAPAPTGNSTFSMFGHDLPLTLAAAIVGAVFALFNGWVSDSLKRLWLRGGAHRPDPRPERKPSWGPEAPPEAKPDLPAGRPHAAAAGLGVGVALARLDAGAV